MTRGELIRMFVLNEISDDYESLEKIRREVVDLAARCRLAVSSEEVLRALKDLIESGMAKAYRLCATPEVPTGVAGVPPDDEIADYWFWVTEKGKERHLGADPLWPFSEDGTLRESWSLDR